MDIRWTGIFPSCILLFLNYIAQNVSISPVFKQIFTQKQFSSPTPRKVGSLCIALRSRSKQIKISYKFDLTSPIYGPENLYFTYYAMFTISIIYILIIKISITIIILVLLCFLCAEVFTFNIEKMTSINTFWGLGITIKKILSVRESPTWHKFDLSFRLINHQTDYMNHWTNLPGLIRDVPLAF